jgi:hypothetical protein
VASRVRWGGCAAAQAVTALYDSTVFGGDTLFAANAEQSDPPQVKLYNNWLVNAGVGFVDGQVASQRAAARVINNTIVGASNSAIRIRGNQWQVDVINNLLAHNQYGLYNESGAANFRAVDNNLFWSNQARVFGVADPLGARGNIQRNPYFVNAAIGDWHITASSGAVDTGQTVSAITFDFDGNRRPCDGNDNGRFAYDIGSDEYATSVKCATPAPTATATATATPTKTPTPIITATPTPTPSGTTAPTTASYVYFPLIALNPIATPTFVASATFIATATFVPTLSQALSMTTPIVTAAVYQ